MATLILPNEIQQVLDSATTDYEATYRRILSERERLLTQSLICQDACGFVALDSAGCLWVFSNNDQTGDWEVWPTSKPRYEVDAAMVGDQSVSLADLVKEIQNEIPGVEVVAVTDSENRANNNTEFCKQFAEELDQAFQAAIENL